MDTNEDRNEITSRCCVCARVRVEGRWQTAVKPAQAGERISHTYCPQCLEAVSPNRRASGRAMLVIGRSKVVSS